MKESISQEIEAFLDNTINELPLPEINKRNIRERLLKTLQHIPDTHTNISVLPEKVENTIKMLGVSIGFLKGMYSGQVKGIVDRLRSTVSNICAKMQDPDYDMIQAYAAEHEALENQKQRNQPAKKKDDGLELQKARRRPFQDRYGRDFLYVPYKPFKYPKSRTELNKFCYGCGYYFDRLFGTQLHGYKKSRSSILEERLPLLGKNAFEKHIIPVLDKEFRSDVLDFKDPPFYNSDPEKQESTTMRKEFEKLERHLFRLEATKKIFVYVLEHLPFELSILEKNQKRALEAEYQKLCLNSGFSSIICDHHCNPEREIESILRHYRLKHAPYSLLFKDMVSLPLKELFPDEDRSPAQNPKERLKEIFEKVVQDHVLDKMYLRKVVTEIYQYLLMDFLEDPTDPDELKKVFVALFSEDSGRGRKILLSPFMIQGHDRVLVSIKEKRTYKAIKHFPNIDIRLSKSGYKEIFDTLSCDSFFQLASNDWLRFLEYMWELIFQEKEGVFSYAQTQEVTRIDTTKLADVELPSPQEEKAKSKKIAAISSFVSKKDIVYQIKKKCLDILRCSNQNIEKKLETICVGYDKTTGVPILSNSMTNQLRGTKITILHQNFLLQDFLDLWRKNENEDINVIFWRFTEVELKLAVPFTKAKLIATKTDNFVGVEEEEDILPYLNASFFQNSIQTIINSAINSRENLQVTDVETICKMLYEQHFVRGVLINKAYVYLSENKRVSWQKILKYFHPHPVTALAIIFERYLKYPKKYLDFVFHTENYWRDRKTVRQYFIKIFKTDSLLVLGRLKNIPWSLAVQHEMPFVNKMVTIKDLCYAWGTSLREGWGNILERCFNISFDPEKRGEFLIQAYSLEEMIGLAYNNSRLLKMLIQNQYPEITDEELKEILDAVPKIIFRAGKQEKDIENESLPKVTESLTHEIVVHQIPDVTRETVLSIGGIASRSEKVCIQSAFWETNVLVREDETFKQIFPLESNSVNTIFVYGLNEKEEINTKMQKYIVKQNPEKGHPWHTVFRQYPELEKSIAKLETSPALWMQFEKTFLVYFTQSKEAGFSMFEEILKEKAVDTTYLDAIKKTQKKFEEIDKMFPDTILNAEDQEMSPFFYQKWISFYIVQQYLKDGKFYLLTTDAGGGKTLSIYLALWYLDQHKKIGMTVVCPNQVRERWAEDGSYLDTNLDQTVVVGDSSTKKRNQLESHPNTGGLSSIVVNREFLRQKKKAPVSKNIKSILEVQNKDSSGGEHVIVVDEARSMLNDSQQSRGVDMLPGFQLMADAYPFDRFDQIRVMLRRAEPNNPVFQDEDAFMDEFNPASPATRMKLQELIAQHSIGVRLDEVFPLYKQNISLPEQRGCLPHKEHLAPLEYYLPLEVCEMILELYQNTNTWKETYQEIHGKMPSTRRWASIAYLRQLLFDPGYMGINIPSPKIIQLKYEVERDILSQTNEKVVILAFYRKEINALYEAFKDWNACRYDGESNTMSFLKDDQNKLRYFAVNQRGKFIIDSKTRQLIPATKKTGKPIEYAQYQHLLFQHSPEHRVLIASIKLARGVNFTGARNSITAHLPDIIVEQEQIDGRTRRVEETPYNKHYSSKYRRVIAKYPPEFLESLPTKIFQQYFSMGTFDEVKLEALNKQRFFLEQFKAGFIGEEELQQFVQKELKSKMPFLEK